MQIYIPFNRVSVLFLHDILHKSPHIKVQLDIFLVFDWEDTWNSFILKSVSLNIALKLVYPSLLPMLINNRIIIHPKLLPEAWKSFLILPVFYSPCSISHQVPVNLTSNHQTCLPPSTSAVASSAQVLIFVVLMGLSCESHSHNFLHPTELSHTVAEMWPCTVLLEALSGHSAVYRVKSRQGGYGPTCSDPASLFNLFPTSQPFTLCALIIPSSWLFPRKTPPRLHTFASTIFYTLPLKVWPMDQQHQHHPRTYHWIRIHVLTKSPGDSIHTKILEYCLECFFHLLCPCCLHALEMECPHFIYF